jgi:Rhodopirellula transposase DDE domain
MAREPMMETLTKEVIASFKDAARKLTGPKRRAFEAQVTRDYFDGNIGKAEEVFGWSHHTVALGLNELRTGITCLDNFSARGNRKTETKYPELEADIRALAEPESQADPKFQSPFLYTRMTAKAVRQALIDHKGWTDEELPHQNTIGEILNRLGIKLRAVQKTKPLKKIKETEAIFANVRQENQAADDDPEVIRISMDTKAKVAVGDFSRDGQSRGSEATKAWDHDPEPEKKLVPQGILDITACLLSLFIGTSKGTSDFFADCLELWWEANKARYPQGRRLVIDLDNGPENSSHRTQFMNRMVMFADATGLEIKLVYYPPYHSKYNPIERCWGILEQHWNGTLLNSIETVVEWAGTMTWKGTRPIVKLIETTYDNGVRIAKDAFEAIESRLQRHDKLPKYDVLIQPQPV